MLTNSFKGKDSNNFKALTPFEAKANNLKNIKHLSFWLK